METSRYEMIVWWSSEDNAFVVDVPELPGCMAHGNTRAEAIANAEEAVAFWLQTAKEDGIAGPIVRHAPGRLARACVTQLEATALEFARRGLSDNQAKAVSPLHSATAVQKGGGFNRGIARRCSSRGTCHRCPDPRPYR